MESVARRSDGRRLFTAEFKRAQVDRILKGEITAAELSRELGVARSLIHRWKCLATKGVEAARGANGEVVAVAELRAAQTRINELERLADEATPIGVRSNAGLGTIAVTRFTVCAQRPLRRSRSRRSRPLTLLGRGSLASVATPVH